VIRTRVPKDPRRQAAGASYRIIQDLDPLEGEWPRLAARARNVFGTWEWASVWRRHFQRGDPVLTTVISRDGAPIAVVPLARQSKRFVRILRVVGHGVGDELGPVCAEADRPEAAAVLRDALDDMPCAWDIFLGERFPADEAWTEGLRGRQLARSPSPVLRFEVESWDDFLQTRSRNQRQQLGRFERSLNRGHRLTYRLANDPDRLHEDLDILFALHNARWRNATSAFARHQSFHREFAACALERGWLRLWFMEVDGTPVAAWYGFRFAGVEFAYQSGRDPALDGSSVGFVLMVHSMREALHDGMREYRFLRGGETYKRRFANEDRQLETIGMSKGLVGAAALRTATALERSGLGGAVKANLRAPPAPTEEGRSG
jgi:CelD/BcsL family acetyltransferase involved in cellulose biosynthesis